MMDWRIMNSRVQVLNRDTGNFEDAFEAIWVAEEATNLIGGKSFVKIVVERNPGDEIYISRPRGDIDTKIVPELKNYGLTCHSDDKTSFLVEDVLLDTLKSASKSFFHEKLGFCNIKGNPAFLAHHPIGIDASWKEAQSTYYHPEVTKPQGTLKAWRNAMRVATLGRPNLELVLALGALSPIAHILREAGLIDQIPLIALIGRTSTGKTTAMQLIGSMFGNPTVSKGLIGNLNATDNAFFESMGYKGGVPILLDETSGAKNTDFQKLIYYLPDGKNKMRCNPDGTIKEPITFSGAIFFTGENSLIKQSAVLKGTQARLLELNLTWTTNATNATFLAKSLHSNYGWAVWPLMNFLLKRPDGWLIAKYEEQLRSFKKKYQSVNGVEDRLMKMYALILVSAIVVKKALQLDLNIDSIEEVLIRNHSKNPPVSKSIEDHYLAVKDYLIEKGNLFSSEKMAVSSGNVWGIRGCHEYKPAYFVKKDRFEKMMVETTGLSFKEARNLFHKAGYIYRSQNRHYTIKKTIGGITTEFYVLYTGDQKSTKKRPKRVGKITPKNKSQLANLLAEDEE